MLANWPYQDDIERMTAEEHVWRRSFDHGLRVQRLTMGYKFLTPEEQKALDLKSVP